MVERGQTLATVLVAAVMAMVGAPHGATAAALGIFAQEATGSERVLPRGRLRGHPPIDSVEVVATPGETEPASFVLTGLERVVGLDLRQTDFTSASGGRPLPASIMDVHVVKAWYQASERTAYKERKKRFLVPELLLHDDALVRVDSQSRKNSLRVALDDRSEYIPISGEGDVVPQDATIADTPTLQPFSLGIGENKQVWLTLRVPADAVPGRYRSRLRMVAGGAEIAALSVDLEVLPFVLADPRLQVGLFYRGQTRDGDVPRRDNVWKTEEQYEIELRDMYDHGVRYPTLYKWRGQDRSRTHLQHDIGARDEVGFPREPVYFYGMTVGTASGRDELAALQQEVRDWLGFFQPLGRSDIYFYGIDEAKGAVLLAERPAWKAVHAAGAKMFVAGNADMAPVVADLLDLAIVSMALDPAQAAAYHAHGHRIFSYANPQAGVEDPGLYRRNYGYRLWKAGYDGSMTYAYGDSNGDAWNDFDGKSRHRDLLFAYPTDPGVIGTVQWEGFREAVDDLRYLATLQDRIEGLPRGAERGDLETWLASLDVDRPPRVVRAEIIDRILALDREVSPTATRPVGAVQATVPSP